MPIERHNPKHPLNLIARATRLANDIDSKLRGLKEQEGKAWKGTIACDAPYYIRNGEFDSAAWRLSDGMREHPQLEELVRKFQALALDCGVPVGITYPKE